MNLRLFSKAHYFCQHCQMAFYCLDISWDLPSPFGSCFSSEASFSHSLSHFSRPSMNNLGSAGSSSGLQETPVISFPMKIHYIFLHFHWEAVYKERHLMQFVHGIACMCRWACASLKAQVTSVSFVLMSWTPLSIPDGTKCLFLGQWIQPFVSCFLSYKLVRTISCCSVALFL